MTGNRGKNNKRKSDDESSGSSDEVATIVKKPATKIRNTLYNYFTRRNSGSDGSRPSSSASSTSEDDATPTPAPPVKEEPKRVEDDAHEIIELEAFEVCNITERVTYNPKDGTATTSQWLGPVAASQDDAATAVEGAPVAPETTEAARHRESECARVRLWRAKLRIDANVDTVELVSRTPFTNAERESMIRYLLDNHCVDRAKGLIIWCMMGKDGLMLGRTPQSLQNHFQKTILPNIEKVTYLTQEEMAKFLALRRKVPPNPDRDAADTAGGQEPVEIVTV